MALRTIRCAVKSGRYPSIAGLGEGRSGCALTAEVLPRSESAILRALQPDNRYDPLRMKKFRRPSLRSSVALEMACAGDGTENCVLVIVPTKTIDTVRPLNS